MTNIALVVSDVDGTLVTTDKTLTDRARAAVSNLHDRRIKFTITSSRPPVGMRFFAEPLNLTLPIGPFNGSSIVAPDLTPIEQHLIPEAEARRSLDVLKQFGVDAWLFTNDAWMIARDDGKYVPHERKTIRHDATIVESFEPYVGKACKIVGASPDAALLQQCETAMQQALGNRAVAVRSQSYYLDVTPPGQDKGVFVRAMSKRLGIPTEAIATIGDMQNDLAMFRVSGTSIAMGNASDEVKAQATLVTDSNENEGFAKAIDMIISRNS